MDRKTVFTANGFDPQSWSACDKRLFTWVIEGMFLQWDTETSFPEHSAAMNDALDVVREEQPALITAAESGEGGFSIIILDFATREKMTITRFGQIPPGRPAEMRDGKRVNIYIDAECVEIASRLGHGNISLGIRTALKNHRNTP